MSQLMTMMCQSVTFGKRKCPYQAKVMKRLEQSKSPIVTTGTGRCDNIKNSSERFNHKNALTIALVKKGSHQTPP